MTIIFGGDTGLGEDAFDNMVQGVVGEFNRIVDGLTDNFTRLSGRPTGLTPGPSKENVYVDDGFQNVPGTVFTGSGNIGGIDDVQTRRITTQTPLFTVYIKKKLFWSLRSEHDTKLMDSGEKLFIRASKLLFERKCSQIASYEALTKLSSLVEEESELDVTRVETIRDIVQEEFLNKEVERARAEAELVVTNPLLSDEFKNEIVDAFQDAVNDITEQSGLILDELDRIAGMARQSKQAIHTTWVVDIESNTDRPKIGRGTGVIELTLVDSVRTSLSLEPGDMGSISFSVQDPYNLLSITNTDVELALASALKEINLEKQGFDLSAGPQEFLEEARRKDEELKRVRNSRLRDVPLLSTIDSNSNPLSGTDLAEIVFEINPSSQASYKVTGGITSLAEKFHKDNYRIVLLQLPLEQQLTLEEDQLVQEIFGLLDEYIDAINRISTSVENANKDKNTEYARKQLRKFYLGKSIVQPMDGVNIYARSNTFEDSEMIGPLSLLLNSSPFVKSFAAGLSPDGTNDAMLEEEMRQFGINNIPVDIYKAIRTSSLLRNAGTHIFGGLITTVSESYNAARGEYVLQVSGSSNMKWLDLSRVNSTPSMLQPQGVLQDPLTPLDIDVNEATGLIEGTPTLSDDNRRRVLFYKNGTLKGEPVKEENLIQNMIHIGNSAHGVRQHAPGLVYKWKQGVISVTQQENLRTSLSDTDPLIRRLRRDVGVTVTKDNPFANLDVADVVSLLVTGFPHNYESFFLNASSVGNFTPGLDSNDPDSFFHSFFDITQSTNKALGNFQPFKFIDVTPEQMSDRLRKQTDLRRENNELKDLQAKIARATDTLNNLQTDSSEKKTIETNIATLTNQLNEKVKAFANEIEAAESIGLKVYGDDIVVDTANTTESGSATSDDVAQRARAKSRLMQFRPQVHTKLNRDNNLFIVSDEYDKDLDIQAFAVELASGEIPIWNSTFKSPREICINAAKVIDFEFFCDTQGNLQLRPPQYNKIPISLLSKMLLLSNEKSVELLPPFVKALFTTRRESLEKSRDIYTKEIEVINILLFGDKNGKGSFDSRGDTPTTFQSDILLPTNISALTQETAGSRATQIQDLKNELASLSGSPTVPDDSDALEEIEKEVIELNDPSAPNVSTRRNTLFNKLIQLTSQKQRVDETLSKLASSEIKEQSFNATVSNATRGLGTELVPGQLSTILEPFGNLLEDDFNDFLGPGSSRRFIIRDDQIISYDFKESDQNVYCRVDVTGQQDLIGESPGQIGNVPIIWAGAVDFDLWKQYGWRATPSVNKPYFKNAELQCAPYALMILSRQKRDVVRATLTVTGNEYYQLGDVVYINNRDMLYYVYGVSHNFSFSGTFTTTLDLRYGHPLGEFIPTPLDVIGKNLIKNQRKFNTTFMFRSTAGNDIGRCVGTVLFVKSDENLTDAENLNLMLSGDLGKINLLELKNALLRINAQKDRPSFNQVEIRGFIRNSSQKDKVLSRMGAVELWLTNPISGFDENDAVIQLDEREFPKISSNIIKAFDDKLDPVLVPELEENQTVDDVKIDPEENKGRTPSEESYSFMDDPNDPKGEFNTVEIVITLKEQV